MMRDVHASLKADQKAIAQDLEKHGKRIRGDASLGKVGYTSSRMGRAEKPCKILFVPAKHQVTQQQFEETMKKKWGVTKE